MSMVQTENTNVQVCKSSIKIIYCIATFNAKTYPIDTNGCLVSKKVTKNKV